MSQLLVTGASGQLGRLVVSTLRAQGHAVLTGSRTPTDGGRVVDFDAPDLAKSFEGVSRLLLISTDDAITPLRRLNQHRRAIDAAVEAGVRHIVYTSYLDPTPDSPVPLAVDHLGTEAYLAEKGLSFTSLRNALYMDNLLASLPQLRATGKLFHASGEGRNAWVSRADCARVAAAALVADDFTRRVVPVTGPQALTATELAGTLASAIGTPVEAIEIPLSDLTGGMVGAGLPVPVAELFASFDVATAQGRHAAVSDAVERYTGAPAETLATFLARSI